MSQRIEDPKQRRSPRDTELETAMRRFFALSAADQLRAFEQIRDYLAAGAPAATRADREIGQRADSLAALTRVAEYLELNGTAPTTEQFDDVARKLRLGWTSGKVVRVWGRWRFACEALVGAKPRLTAAQRSLRHRNSGLKRSHEDYLTAVRLWLATAPSLLRVADYNAWAAEHNEGLNDDEPPVPKAHTARSALALSWLDVLRVANGEVALDEVEKWTASKHADWTSGPHDFVGQLSGAQILKVSANHFHNLSHKTGFPTPVAIFAGRRHARVWLREDLETYRETGAAPKRKRDSLRHLYYGTTELAPLVGLTRPSLSHKRRGVGVPATTGRVGGFIYWLKRDADRWIRENRELVERRLSSHPIKRRPTTPTKVA